MFIGIVLIISSFFTGISIVVLMQALSDATGVIPADARPALVGGLIFFVMLACVHVKAFYDWLMGNA